MALNVEAVLMTKRFETPDEVRPFKDGMGKTEFVDIGGRMVGRGTFEPGWRWSEHVKPIAQTDSCEVLHLGYVLQGRMRIHMDNGEVIDLMPGDAFEIPPNHDAEVTGDEACVLLDFGEIAHYAQSPGH